MSRSRIHEFKHYHPEDARTMSAPATVVCREYPKTWARGGNPTPWTRPPRATCSRATRRRRRKVPNLVVGGRLGDYKYYDMDRSVAAALQAAAAFLPRRPA